MTNRLKRERDFEIALKIKNDDFIRPPRDAQRNWVLNRAMKEFSEDLNALHLHAKNFISGVDSAHFSDRKSSSLTSNEIMEDWQIPVMKAMAEAVTASQGDILEIGFGRGIASEFIQDADVHSHTIIECNPGVIRQCDTWKKQKTDKEIHVLEGMWQDVTTQMGMYDGIFFHTYPLNENEYIEQVIQSTTFAEHFFPIASEHLKTGGSFSYLSNEIDSLSRSHQRLLFRYFSSFTLSRVTGLKIPEDTHDAQWSDTMVIIKAVK